jgi:hypothetical protein
MCCNICRNARCDGAGAQKKESKESHRRGRGCLLPRLGLCKSRETVLGNHRKSCNGPLPLVDFIDAEQTSICFGPKLGARIEKMDPHALDAGLEERAAALFGTLVALARAETLSSIGEGEKAFGILGSFLRGETATSGAPAS